MSSYSDTLKEGATVGCYQIEEVLGRGGFAVTYLAIDLNLDVYVAIKEFLPREIIKRDSAGMVSAKGPDYAEDYQTGLDSFAREAKTLALFKHPNIVRVHQVLHENNTAYMVMEYEHGQELAEVLENQKSLSENDLRAILLPVFDGVAEIHNRGYVHRDIKPSNIYLRDNGSPVLLDFGAARYTMSETTQQLTAMVTVGYTPIEQYNVSEADQGPWSDIYALAAVLYEAVTGTMPVDSVTRASTALTNTEDPLVSVRDRALHPCSNDFYDAVDWGLRMDANERPQSISQWRAAFDGDFEAPAIDPAHDAHSAHNSGADSGGPPTRKSKLRFRAKTLAATESDSYRQNTNDFITRNIDIDQYPDSRIEPSFGDSLESIDVGDPPEVATLTAPSHAGQRQTGQQQTGQQIDAKQLRSEPPTTTRPTPAPAVAEGDRLTVRAPISQSGQSTREPPVLLKDGYNTGTQSSANLTNTPAAKTNTQQIRDVVRRDIMKRDVGAEPQAEYPTRDENEQPAGPELRPGRIRMRGSLETANDKPYEPAPSPPYQDDIEFDESDWDYEPPGTASRWKWLIPITGLAAVFAASMVYVSRPDLLQWNKPEAPDLTIDAALGRAQEKIESSQLIFPAGESAVDYYQLVLTDDPDNEEALAGIERIEQQVREGIVTNVENNNLSEANRLLSRANKAGLQIDSLPAAGETEQAQVTPAEDNRVHSRVKAIDQNLSPYLQREIAKIDQAIADGDAELAQSIFDRTEKYIPNTSVSTALQQRITETQASSVLTSRTDETESPLATTDTEAPAAVDTDILIEASDAETDTSASINVPDITNQLPSRTDNQTIAIAPRQELDTNTFGNQSEPSEPPASEPNEPSDKPARVTVPRKSYIAGRGEPARHLNQLRTAIEAKNIDQVLRISNSLPKERVDFLRQMFRRYDRIDVVIDQISDRSDRVTANLDVAMFNQRSDGSYYSAGRWNGVTMRADKDNGAWQKIDW